MTDALALRAKLLALLEESARTTTYKPALLLALIDRVQEYVEHETVPVRALAERVVELYWPQTLAYPTTGGVLRQSQTSTGRAAIVPSSRSATSTAQQPVRCRQRSGTHTNGSDSSHGWRRRSPNGRSRDCSDRTSHSSTPSIGDGQRPEAGRYVHTATRHARSDSIRASETR